MNDDGFDSLAIRPTDQADMPDLMQIAAATGVFKRMELQALSEVLHDFFAENQAAGHCCVTAEQEGQALGFAYYAPAAMTDRTWYLYWIAVRPPRQARGVGSALLHHAEETVRRHNGRLLLIETSSLPHYKLTRRFYARHGYDVAAVLKDFYSDGDDMVVFGKRLAVVSERTAGKAEGSIS